MAMKDTLYTKFLDLKKSSDFVGAHSLYRFSSKDFVACGFTEFDNVVNPRHFRSGGL